MFFYLSKLLWFVIAPTNLTVLALIFGVLFLLVRPLKRAGRVLTGIGLVGLIMFGILPTGHNLTVYLEKQAERMPLEISADLVDGIILLGGMFHADISTARNTPEANHAIDRVRGFQELARKHPTMTLYYTGGKADLRQNDMPEAAILSDYFSRIGFASPVIYEAESRNTYENALFLHDKLKAGDKTFVLITSATHMPRAYDTFKSAGYDIIAYPVDYQTDGVYRLKPVALRFSWNFFLSDLAVREIVGHLAYRFSGKI